MTKEGNQVIKKESVGLKGLLEQKDVLLMLYGKDESGGFYNSITQEDERTIYSLLQKKEDKKTSILIFIDSGGGNVYAAVKILDLLRSMYTHIEIAVAEEAKSSATMMCLGADSLVLCPISELGPLDKPMLHPDNETSSISALDIIRSLDGIIDVAIGKQEYIAGKLMRRGVSKRDAFSIAGDTVSGLMEPILSKEDGKIYNQARRLLVIAEVYGKDLLTKHALSYIDDDVLRKKIAEIVIERFIWEYPDHNFAIRREEISERLFLRVKKSEDVDYWKELWDEFEKSIGNEQKIIKFL